MVISGSEVRQGPTPNLGDAAVRGATVTVLSQGGKFVLLLASTAVLSRLLRPADFGLMAIVVSIVAFGELFRDLGLSLAAVRATDLSPAQRINLFWMNLALGLVCAVVLFFTAPLIASVFSDPRLTDVLRAVAPVFVLSGATAQFRAEINRSMRFGRLALVDLIPAFAGLAAAIAVALMTGSYWALVLQQLVIAVIGGVLSCAWGGFRLGVPRRAPMGQLVSFGAGLFGTQLMAYAARNADTILIGAFLGARPLGFYSRAYQLVMAPLTQVQAPLTRVAVPVLARAWNDREQFSRFLVRGQMYSGVVVAVLYAALAGLSTQVVAVLLGDQWGPSVPLFAALCAGGVFRALAQVNFWAFVASGRTTSQFRLYLVTQPLIVAMMAIGLIWGVLGVAIGHAVGYLIAWVVSTFWAGRALELNVGPLFRSATLHLAVWCVPVAALTSLVSLRVPGTWTPLLLGSALTGLYLAVATMLVRPVRHSLVIALRDLRRIRGTGS